MRNDGSINRKEPESKITLKTGILITTNISMLLAIISISLENTPKRKRNKTETAATIGIVLFLCATLSEIL